MNKARYLIRTKADQDLDDQAYYYALNAGRAVGHRFLASAHETFSLIASQPQMGWNPKLRLPELRGLRLFRVSGFEKILILYRPLETGVEILRVIHGSQNVRRLLRQQGIE